MYLRDKNTKLTRYFSTIYVFIIGGKIQSTYEVHMWIKQQKLYSVTLQDIL